MLETISTIPDDKIQFFWETKYINNVLTVNNKLDITFNEIDYLLKTISLDGPIKTNLSIEFLRIVIKNYNITFITLNEIVLDFINVVYRLGLPTKTCNMETVMQNENIDTDELNAIFKKYRKILYINDYSEDRNLVVHENQLKSRSIIDLTNDFEKAISTHVATFAEEAMRRDNLDQLAVQMAEIGKKYYRSVFDDLTLHWKNTKNFINEILESLSIVFQKKVKELT